MSKRSVGINENEKNDAMQMIRLIGYPVIQAPSEAEPQCAWLVKNNLAFGTISEDLDTLTFGSNKLIRSFNKKDNCVEVDL